MNSELRAKYDALQNYFQNLGNVAIAFSGGVDSTLLLQVANEVLGDKTLAITARATMIPAREIREAQEFSTSIGANHIIMDVDALSIDGFAENPPERCYICKTALFSKILEKAAELGFSYVAEGTNTSDLGDYRPGLQALKELEAKSPYLACDISKDEVRAISKELELPTWNKPSYACLASRVPYNSPISENALRAVESAEDLLIDAGFDQVRCRAHGNLARIEVAPTRREELMSLLATSKLSQKIHDAGFKYVTVDADGYRTGSFNSELTAGNSE